MNDQPKNPFLSQQRDSEQQDSEQQNPKERNPEQRRIVMGVGGGIAAYKVCEVVSSLAKQGHAVQVVLTQEAQEFITPLTLAALSRHPAHTDADFWSARQARPLHIVLGEWAEVLVLAPLTAHTLAQLAHGLADNLLMNTVLASTCPILLAPAMNTDMWEQRVVQRNWRLVQEDSRCHAVGPGAGILACDRRGPGRLAEPEQILAHIDSLLHTGGKRDLLGKRVVVSGGGTREPWDPVRFIGNPASGRMGVAIAQAAHHRGAQVTFVHGPMDGQLLAVLPEMRTVPVVTSVQMEEAMNTYFPEADITIMAAAVGDVKPATYYPEKVPKQDLPEALPLVPVTDIVAGLGKRKRPDQILVGFAAQTGDILPPALDKLKRKNLDVIVANPVDQVGSGFGQDNNQAIFIDRHHRKQPIPLCSKLIMAHQLLDFVQTIVEDHALA